MKRVLKFLDEKLELSIAVLLMFLLVILAAWSVLSRFIFNHSLAWSEELIRYVFILMNYMAASAAVIHDQHARVEIADLVLPPKVLKWLNVVLKIAWAVFSLVIGINSITLVQKTFTLHQNSPTLGIEMGYIYLVLPVCFFLMTFRIIQNVYRLIRRPAEIPAVKQ